METTEGWLFDAYPEEEGMRVWLIERGGRRRSALDPWRPAFSVAGGLSALRRVLRLLSSLPYRVDTRGVEKKELFSGAAVRVLEVRVPVLERDPLVRRLAALEVPLYDADVHLVQTWHYDRGHFPLALGVFSIEGETLAGFAPRDDAEAVDYEVPSLRFLHLAWAPSEIAGRLDPSHSSLRRLIVSSDGRASELEGGAAQQLETLARRLRREDPDVITTDWGDSSLLPELEALAREHRVPLDFSREEGRAVYQGGARYFCGRWHLDLKNSFMLKETGTAGLFEIARIAQIPVQRAARCTIGTSLSSMQMAWAWSRGILIPMEKQQAEDFRPAGDLLVADKGGLVYEPEVGWHRSVAEFDFTSMYPEMMVRRNISPETVNCLCCPANFVPEIGHRLCTRRRGLVPSVLEPILLKRAKYKARAKAGGPRAADFKQRAAAHKWCLVTCFGYLGFKNARFGKIEAQECVTAWGREVLLRAKDAVESRGYRLLHALVDAIWITVPPGADLEELRRAIEKEAECPLSLEGVYEWIRYCPSKEDARSGVPGRYFGAFTNGELKVRGIASRRRDTPELLKAMQSELLNTLAKVSPGGDLRELVPGLLDIVAEYRLRLREGRVAADAVKEWRSKPLSMMENGLEYDVKKYLELLDRAAWEILDGLAPAPETAPKPRPAPPTRALELPLGWP